MNMSLKPSGALSALYQKECRDACAKYIYWWSYKAAVVVSQKWDLSHCVRKCVHDTVKRERPILYNKHIKKSDMQIAGGR